MKSNTKRRLNWAATLALLLTLLPNGLTAAAADTYSLYVGGVEITSENLTVNGDSGTATYDPASHTLTLDNYSYTGAGYGDSEGGGIDYRGGTDLTIVLNGSNSIVKSSVSTPGRSHGIYFSCSGKTLTISGEGSLNISFQSASSGIWKRNGIHCEPGAFVMESGTVTSAGGTADESAGIFTNSGITINGGTFTGIGNPTTDYESRGIYSHGSITVNGGKAIGRATNTDKTAYAFQGNVTVNGGELTASASTDSGEAKAFSWDSCEVAGELLEMRVGDSAESAVATTNPDDVSGKRYAYIKTTPLPSYTATFDANGGEGIMDAISGLKGHQITFPANVFSAPIGKTFNGWSDGESTYQPGESYTLAADVTFSAIWADIVTVTFDSNGGGAVDSQTIPKNASAEKPKAPARDGFIFRGWELDGTSYDFSSPVVQDITLTASWIEGLSVAADFEDGAFPDGWTQEGNGGWSVGTGDYNDGTGAHGGSRNAKITHSDNGNETWLIMPAQDLSGKSAVSLSFWYINRSWGSDIDAFGAYYRLDGGDWTELFATTEAHGGWTEWSGTLPDAALDPNVEIGFRMTDNFGFGVGLDDVSLEIGGHSWSYAAEGAAIIATCQNDPCELGENKSLSLTLTESDGAVVLDGLDAFNAATGLAVSESDIQYYSGETLLSETPSGLGSYTAKLTVQGVTASKAFQISEPVSYQDAAWNETTQSVDFTEKTATSYTPVTSDSTSWTDGWYVADSDVTISSRITVTGDVHLILADGKTLTASSGITVTGGNTLEIYGQNAGTGTLNATSSDNTAIGVGVSNSWGSPTVGDIVIYGGNVTATGNTGIGYSSNRVNQMAGTLTVYGGTLAASTNADGAGIGGAWNDAGLKTVTIYGGAVTANGGVRAAAIGGGCQNRDNPSSGKGGDVYIYGGTVTAKIKDGTTYGGEGKTPVAIGKGDGGSDDGSITLGRYMILYGGTSESDLVTIASPYTARYKYMKAVYTPPVASVTDGGGTVTKYGTLADALAAWTDGSTLTLLDNVTTDSTINVIGTKTLDLNGYGIQMLGASNSSRKEVINIRGINSQLTQLTPEIESRLNHLTLIDSRPTTTYYFTAPSGGAGLATNISDTDTGGQQSFHGGYITGGYAFSGGGIRVDNGGRLTMTGGTIIGNTGLYGGGMDVEIGYNGSSIGGTAIITGGAVMYNYGTEFSGGIHTNGAYSITISDCQITHNSAKNGIGGINWEVNNHSASFSVSGGTVIEDNQANGKESNVCLGSGKYITVEGALTSDATIGVTMPTPGVFTNSATTDYNDESVFTSDDASYVVMKNADGQLELVPARTVTFNANGHGTAPDPMTGVGSGSTITEPAAPAEIGYDFGGWYKDADCTAAWDFSADTVTEDIILYAKWTLAQYTVTVENSDNGKVTADKSTASMGDTVTLTVTPDAEYELDTLTVTDDASNSVTVNSNTFTMPPGNVTVSAAFRVKPAQTITADDVTVTYGDTGRSVTASTDGGGTITYAVASGDAVTVDASTGALTILKTGTATVTVTAAESDSYRTTTRNVAVTVNRKDLTVTAAAQSKTYGEADPELTFTASGFVGGDTESVITGALSRDAGEDVGTYAIVQGTLSAGDNYDISFIGANLTIGKAALTVTADGKAKTYGDEDPELTYTTEGLVSGDTLSGALSRETGENAGEYAITLGTLSAGDNYEVNFVGADLTIGKRAVTLTSATDSKVYDGAALTNSEVTVSGDGFASGEGATYNVTGTRTLPGSSANAFTYTLNEGTKADNYEITTVNGTLTVTNRTSAGDAGDTTESRKYEITLTANSDTVLYDGAEHTVSGFETLEFTFNNVTYTVSGLSAEVTGTDAGTYPVTVNGTAVVKDSTGNDLTAQFIVNTVDGSLTINKRSVTLTSATDSKPYDGNAMTNNTVTVTGDGFIDGEGADYNVTGTQRIVGSSPNSFNYTLNSGTKADNYTITKTEGTLTVTSREAKYEISPQANSDSVKYDGQAHTVSGFVADSFTVEGNTYTVSGLTASATGTNVGTYTVSVDGTAVVTDSDSNDVSSEFSVTPQTGTLTISKREVTLTSATAEKEYDGTALTDDTVTVGGDGFASGEGAAYSVTGTRTLVGASENTFTYTLNDGTLADNYTITTANGNLTVTNRNAQYTVTLTANSGEYLYDGAEKAVTGWTIDGAAGGVFTASNGLQYTVSGMTAEIQGTDAGTYTVNVTGTPVVTDSGGNDVTDQFAVSTESGMLTINKRSVTLTSATDSKVYDGATLTNDTVTVNGDGFASGEGAAYTVTGSQTLPGSSANAFTYTLNEGTEADNYDITKTEGTLTVTNRTSAGDAGDTTESRKYEITLTANSGEFQYDGRSHSVSGFETLEYTFGGVTYTVSGVEASATATNAGETDVVITGTPVVKVKDSDGTDLAAQFIVNKVPGKLTITKATPEYTVPTGLSATYGDTLSDVVLPSGWTWDNPSASVGDAGTSTFSVMFTPSDTGNYNTVTETVSVTVNKAVPDAGQLPYAVSGLVYDGAAHTLVIGGSSDDGVYHYRLGTDGAWSEALPSATEAGSYTVYYYLAGDTNHLDLGSESAPLGSVSTAIASPETPVISGKVFHADDGTEIGGAAVRLMRGSEETASTVTAPDGSYQLAAEPGLYNIVVEWNGGSETLTKTEMIAVSGDTTKDVAVSSDSVNSVLEVMPETPSVIVGGLDAEAQSVQAEDGGSVVTVRMVVERGNGDTSAIQSAAAGQDLDSFEIRVEKTVNSVTTPLTQTRTVLELVIPCSFGGKENVRMLRVHDGSAAPLTESASGEDATFWLDKANGFIHVYANQFSTYAVAYTQCYNITGAIAYGDYTGTVVVSLVEVNSKTPAASREISLSGGMGAYSFTHIPKGTYTLTANWLDGETETTLNKEIEVR